MTGYSARDLAAEIRVVIEAGIAAQRPMPAPEIAAAILARHPLPAPYNGSNVRDFVVLACSWMVREQVHKILATLRPRRDPRQPHLPGFTRLLPAYIVLRDGTETIVPTPLMTDDELEAKADEYEAMAAGCYDHAAELRSYRVQRRNAA